MVDKKKGAGYMQTSDENVRKLTTGTNKPVWLQEPKIKPNIVPKHNRPPKSKIKQVLLFGNFNEERKLATQLKSINLEQNWASNLHAIQRKSFAVRQILQEQHLQSKGVKIINMIPEALKNEFKHQAMFHNISQYGAKDLPMWQSLDTYSLRNVQAKFTIEEMKREEEKKAHDKNHRHQLTLGLRPNKRIATGRSDRSSLARSTSRTSAHSAVSTARRDKLPRLSANDSSTLAGPALKTRTFTTYNTRLGRHLPPTNTHFIDQDTAVVDPRFAKLCKSLTNIETTNDPYLNLSESSWGDKVQQLSKSESDVIHRKYMPSSCYKGSSDGDKAWMLFPKAMGLVQRYQEENENNDL